MFPQDVPESRERGRTPRYHHRHFNVGVPSRVACEQALGPGLRVWGRGRGRGWGKEGNESLQRCLTNLNVSVKKLTEDADWWRFNWTMTSSLFAHRDQDKTKWRTAEEIVFIKRARMPIVICLVL